nr:BRCT [Hymenolepis microstoma]
MTESVFSNVRYYVIDSEDNQLVDDLKFLGATSFPALTDSLKFAISDKGDSAEVYEAEELIGLYVVTSSWVRKSIAMNAFLPFKPFHPKFKKIFHGLNVVIAELPANDVLKLTAHLTIRGASCSGILDSNTTHLILGRASGFLYERCKAHFPSVRMISPDWVVECLKGQELIDCENYNVELLVKPAPPKPPIMPKPAPVHLIDQSIAQKQLPQGLATHLGGIGTSVSAIGTSIDGTHRILSTNAGVIGFTTGGVPVVSQAPQAPMGTTFHQQQQIHPHLPEPKPAKGSSKSKANKHPSEQGLNEEQKDAIVMQNVKTILGSQANRNKDNASNRGDGQLPGAFLPTGSTPIATGGAQRKPKSPKSPANRGSNSSAGGVLAANKFGPGGQKGGSKGGSSGGAKRSGELAEIAPQQVQPQPQGQQQFATLTVDASGAATTQLFQHSTVLVAAAPAAQPGTQMTAAAGPRMAATAAQQNGAFLLQQQQQQHQQYQQQALLAAQNQFQKNRMAAPQQVQVSPLLLQSAQGQTRATTATFIVRAPSDIQLGQAVTTGPDSVQALLDSNNNAAIKEGQQQVILQPASGQATQQQHLIHLQQQQQRRSSSPSANPGGVLSPVFIQGRQPQPLQQQYKQQGQMQVQMTGLQTQPAIRPQPQPSQNRPSAPLQPQQGGIRQNIPPLQPSNQQQQQQYAQLTQQQVKPTAHQMGGQGQPHQQQIIIQTSAGVQQVVTAQELSSAQYSQMRAMTPVGQSTSPRPTTTGIIGSSGYTQQQQQQQQIQQQEQVLTSNGIISSSTASSNILYHSSVPTAAAAAFADASTGIPQDRVAYIASIPQQQQPQAPGGRFQQTMINVSGGRVIPSSLAGAPASILQASQQQAVAIQQGQFYGQSTVPSQPPQRILVQSPQQQSQGMLATQGPIPAGGGFIQQQRQQLLPQQQQMMTRGPMSNSQIRQMMTAQSIQQTRHIVPPPPQYRSGGYVLPARSSLNSVSQAPGGAYGPNTAAGIRAQQIQQINPAVQQQQAQIAPQVPPGFQLPNFKGHVGYNCPTAHEDCLIGCVMMLVGYTNFSESTRALWKKIIRSYGGEVVNTYVPSRVTHVIMDWKLGDAALYEQVLRDRKRVVTIYWLNDVLANGQMVPPFEIIHLPSAFAPYCTLKAIKAQIISITGFEGTEKLKVEAIIKQIGATYTDYLDEMNTFLVCKKPEGEKYKMARHWGVRCVNLRWLQDLYLGDARTLDIRVPHKYLCFDKMDVTIALELRTAEVQEMMIGWNQGICVTPASWERLGKLREILLQEEKEEEAKAALQCQKELEAGKNDEDAKENRFVLPALTTEEVEKAKTGKLRSTLLREEANKVTAHRAKLAAEAAAAAAALAAQQQQLYLVQTNSQGQQIATSSLNCQSLPISSPPTSTVFPVTGMPTLLTPTQAASTQPIQSGQQPTSVGSNSVDTPLTNFLKRPLSPPSHSPSAKRQAFEITHPKSVPTFPVVSPIEINSTERPSSANQLLPSQPSQPISADHAPIKSEEQVQPLTQLPTPQSINPPAQTEVKSEVTLDLEVRIVFTDLSAKEHEVIVQLIEQMPKEGIAPHRFVDSVCDATHVVTLKLSRTLKTYHAMAFGVPIVSAKWIQASLIRGDWLAETEWLLEDPEGEQNLGIQMATSYARARERRLLSKPGLFAELEFWFSPMAHHRAVCEELVRLCGGRIRERRPTQKMALLTIPKQVIICHEEDANVAAYLMRTKTGNRAVHHEEFILSGVLRQELDFESYQIQLVSIQFAELTAAINANMNSSSRNNVENTNPNPNGNVTPAPVRNVDPRSELPVAPLQSPPSSNTVYMRPPNPPSSQHPQPSPPTSTTPRSCLVFVSGAADQSNQPQQQAPQSSVMYYIPSESGTQPPSGVQQPIAGPLLYANHQVQSHQASVAAPMPASETLPMTALRLPSEGVSDTRTITMAGDETTGLNAARVAANDAHVVASATAALTTNPTLIANNASGGGVQVQGQLINFNSPLHQQNQQLNHPPPPSSTGMM